MRGEDNLGIGKHDAEPETPPHAWGRRRSVGRGNPVTGNTPTCVGKTQRRLYPAPAPEKHPHMRGEDDLLYRRKAYL